MKIRTFLIALTLLMLSAFLLASCATAGEGNESAQESEPTETPETPDGTENTGNTEENTQTPPQEDWNYQVLYTSNGDGTCSAGLRIHPMCSEDFEAVIPDKSPEGDVVTSYRDDFGYVDPADVPRYISAEVFEERIRKPLLKAVENGALGGLPSSNRAEDNFYYKMYMTYFQLKDPALEEDAQAISAMYLQFPFTKQKPYYVFAADASTSEITKVRNMIDSYTDFTMDDWRLDYYNTWKLIQNDSELPAKERNHWEGYFHCFSNHLTGVILPDSATRISGNAFRNATDLKRIVLPENLSYIGVDAFAGCDSLRFTEYQNGYYLGSAANPYSLLMKVGSTNMESFEFHQQAKQIYQGVFAGCENLRRIELPDSVTFIPSLAFYGCISLEQIVIPSGVTTIGTGAFYDCCRLTEMLIPNGVTSLGTSAFAGCSGLRSVEIPQSVKWLGPELFYECHNLESVGLPDGMERIPNGMFFGCESLREITLPDSVTVIGNYAFYRSGLTTLSLPAGVTKICDGAFIECNNLTQIRFEGTTLQWRQMEIGDAFYDVEVIFPDETATGQDPEESEKYSL